MVVLCGGVAVAACVVVAALRRCKDTGFLRSGFMVVVDLSDREAKTQHGPACSVRRGTSKGFVFPFFY